MFGGTVKGVDARARAAGATYRADAAAARGCETCNGWGTMVAADGRLELCPACQRATTPEPSPGLGPARAPSSPTSRPPP